MAEITFFHNSMSRGQIVRWALEEVGADYDVLPVAWDAKPQALLDANPMGKIPTIIHHTTSGDRVVTEVPAISHYLAEIHPDAELLPREGEKADYFRWLFFAAGPVEQAIMSRTLNFEPDKDQQRTVGFGSVERTVDTLDGWLKEHAFVCGDRFTMADVYVGSHVDWGITFEMLPYRDSFKDYANRLRTRPAYRKSKQMDGVEVPA
ncbi:glutathione S-transferase family protein [Croceicoccus naphthovorans]|uniref:Glutathione S-transferase n=1 Tax=Croceicoccus naphthovorans TaxID=1348774 RepID=A0A0G3XF57_9SPHN|nr:glutathione S-transferase family protein [Croceicoccus naphthovorans]AKM09239.1 glutathione S-transferase [Croceicoccus naphthovorans]MBB3990373.1 glutathione S-transferase [Croceicoccus naphthovorans]